MPRPLICIFHLCPPLYLFIMYEGLSMQSFMLSSKCAQFFCLEPPLLRLRQAPEEKEGKQWQWRDSQDFFSDCGPRAPDPSVAPSCLCCTKWRNRFPQNVYCLDQRYSINITVATHILIASISTMSNVPCNCLVCS